MSVTGPETQIRRVARPALMILIFGLTLCAVWSFTEYRRLRERIPDPRPPSAFRRPSRLVTILYSRDKLDPYGRRVKLTGFVFTTIGFLIAIVAFVLVTAS